MFARSVSFHSKPGRAAEFTQLIDKDVDSRAPEAERLPGRNRVRRPSGSEAVGISVWDLKENAETYGRGAYAGVLKTLEQVCEGTPQVKTYEVSNSTFHKIAARATV